MIEKRSIMSKPGPASLELSLWTAAPKELTGKEISLERLEELFPEGINDTGVDLLEKKEKYNIIGKLKEHKSHTGESWIEEQRLAYQCNKCEKIIIGPPNIYEQNDFANGTAQPLAGREGYDLFCHNCGEYFDGETFKAS